MLRSSNLVLEFEWDSKKARKNQQKHGISFEQAATIFGDPLSITIEDPDNSEGENRHITIGMTYAGNIVIVVHLDKEDSIRIISARAATFTEKKKYEEAR